MSQPLAILTGGCFGTLIGFFVGCSLGFKMFAHEGFAALVGALVGAPSGLIFGAALGNLAFIWRRRE